MWDVNKQSYGVWDMGEATLGMTKLSAILGMQGLLRLATLEN